MALLRPADHDCGLIWSPGHFEFETPALDHQYKVNKDQGKDQGFFLFFRTNYRRNVGRFSLGRIRLSASMRRQRWRRTRRDVRLVQELQAHQKFEEKEN